MYVCFVCEGLRDGVRLVLFVVRVCVCARVCACKTCVVSLLIVVVCVLLYGVCCLGCAVFLRALL